MTFHAYKDDRDLHEVTAQHSRYSVEVNYRTELSEVTDAFAKLVLGYVSAAIKNCGYHCKILLNTKPYRVLACVRNWDDGEWVSLAVFDHKKHQFIMAEGSYNKVKKTVTIAKSEKSDHKSASDIVREMRNTLERLKKTDPIRSSALKPVKLKTGPKPKSIKDLAKKLKFN